MNWEKFTLHWEKLNFSFRNDPENPVKHVWRGVFSENSKRLSAIKYVCKKLHLRYLLGPRMRFCMAVTALHITDTDSVEGEGTEELMSPKKNFFGRY